MKRSEFFNNWSLLHGNAEVKGIVKSWLTISFFISWPLVKARVSPNLLSVAAPFVGLIFYLKIDSHWAIFLLVLSLLLDGIDGSIAILTKRTSKFGALLDGVMDRITEFFWALAFIKIGGPVLLVAIAAIFAFGQEYLRARSGGLGVNEVLVVTLAERPVRATMIFIPLIARLFQLELASFFAILWSVMQTLSFIYLFLVLRSRLRQSPR